MSETENTKVGEALLDYALTLVYMVERLQEVTDKASLLLDNVVVTYEGDAQAEIWMFLDSLVKRLALLTNLYSKMFLFVNNTYIQFHHTDELLVNYLLKRGSGE